MGFARKSQAKPNTIVFLSLTVCTRYRTGVLDMGFTKTQEHKKAQEPQVALVLLWLRLVSVKLRAALPACLSVIPKPS